MDPVARGRAEAFWARKLGCPEPMLREPGLHLRPSARAREIFTVGIGASLIARAPAALQASLAALSPEALLQPSSFAALVGAGARFVGPAFVGYATSFPPPSPDLVRFPSTDAPEFDALLADLPAEQWEHANLEAAAAPIFAAVSGGSVLAASGAELLQGGVAHLGVATHPRHRRRGLARGVVSAAASVALEAGLLPQYQTLCSNRPAMVVGHALGFEAFATTLVVRWEEPDAAG